MFICFCTLVTSVRFVMPNCQKGYCTVDVTSAFVKNVPVWFVPITSGSYSVEAPGAITGNATSKVSGDPED